MPKASPLQTSFSSGELAPEFGARVDLEEYASGCRKIENMIPLIEGPAQRRGGTRFVRAVKDATDRTGFLRFQFNIEQAYVLEIGDQYMRFYTDHGIVLNGTNPLEVATPWTAADLFDSDGNFLLRAVQSGDVLYITHTEGTYAPQKLTRTSALSWSIASLDQEGGPFEDLDPDETVTVFASAATGNGISLTASSAIFNANHVGALFLLEQNNTDDVAAWEAGKTITTGIERRVDNRVYVSATAGTSGAVTPSHTVGSAYDGDPGVQWTFRHPGYGWVKITAVGSSGTTATANVLSRIPAGAVGSGEPTTRWAFGAWSADAGYPTHVTFFRERLTFARATTREFWMSEAGDFERFRSRDDGGETVADSAIRGEVTSDQVNRIEWLAPSDFALLIGTAGGEFAIHEITTSEPLGPGNVKSDHNSSYGSRAVRPVRVGDAVIYVQRSGRKLRDLAFTIEKEKFGSANMNVLARHLLPKGKAIVAMAYQQEPHSVVWALRSDGQLLGMTLNANQRRFGWHQHPVGGVFGTGDAVVEAIEVIPNPTADADELWMIVKRTVNGSTVRYVEYMEQEWDRAEDIIEAFYVDSGLTYDGTEAATLTPGAGATVEATANVTFTAGSSVFVSGDIGKEIRYRYTTTEETADGEEYTAWHTARAEITAVNSGTVAQATIIAAFPSTSAIAASGWGITVTTISGLDHLEGQTLDLLVDGAVHPQRTVASGAVTLQTAGFYIHAGLPCPCEVSPMRLEAGAADGTAQGKTKRIHRTIIRLLDTVGGKTGPHEGNTDEILFRDPSMDMDEPVPPFSGDKEMAWPNGYEQDGYMTYVNDQPLPATVVAFMPQLVTQDR
jgi:hypothetical protein